ncbi:MAG: hypothetical protein U9R02_06400 [Thermodesulfobacteriota bacterium]|nr:hypothetical protein [Thermodesulfobacteriota bacterium]
MGQAELIYELSKQLPVPAQHEMLDFAQFLGMKKGKAYVRIGTMDMPGSGHHRTSHSDIAGKTRIMGDPQQQRYTKKTQNGT